MKSPLTTTSAAAKAAAVAALSPAFQSKMRLPPPGRSSRTSGAPGASAVEASISGGSGS